MADFNPQVPNTQDPNYFRYSEPIGHVEANKSTAVALSGAAAIGDDVLKFAEKTTENIIKKDVRDTIEPIRNDFTQSLEAARANLVPAPVQTDAGSAIGTPTSLAPQPMPDAVRSGLDKITSLQDAFVNGKINDTWYHSRLDRGVTELRTRYPGFKDDIDREVSKVTGVIPANAYIADLMQDINRSQTNKKTEQDKELDLARGAMTKGFDKANLMFERLQSDPSFAPKFRQWYTEENAKFTRLQYEDLQRNNFKGNKEAFAADRLEKLNGFFASTIDSDLNATLTLAGAKDPDTIMGIIQKAAADPSKFSEAQMEEFAAKVQSHGNIMKSQLQLLSDRKGYTQDVGTTARDEALKSNIALYDNIYKALREGGSGGAGLAFFHMNQARAVYDQTKYNLTTGELGPYLNNSKIVQESLGPAFSGILVPMLLKEQLPDKLRPLFQQNVIEGRAQPGGDDKPTSVVDHMDAANKDKRLDPVRDKPYLLKGYLNTANDIKNPGLSNEDKSKVVTYMFNPKNNTMLQNFKMDYETRSPDGRLKIEHPGKNKVWTDLTDKDISDNIAKLDVKSRQLYSNWVDTTGRELIGEDVKNLNHFTGHDNLYFEWNTKTKNINIRDKEGALAPIEGQRAEPYAGGFKRPPPDSYIWQVQKVVDRINGALNNLDHVYTSFGGGNTEQTLLNTLQRYGLDFNGKVSGLPKAMGDAIAASRKKPEEPEKK